jgi:hypothetical protein
VSLAEGWDFARPYDLPGLDPYSPLREKTALAQVLPQALEAVPEGPVVSLYSALSLLLEFSGLGPVAPAPRPPPPEAHEQCRFSILPGPTGLDIWMPPGPSCWF